MTKFLSEDETVSGILDVYPVGSQVSILNIRATEPRKGQGRRAMIELREKYKGRRLVAVGVGYPVSGTRRFWLKMAEEGLVDELLHDDQSVVWTNRRE